MTDHAKHIRAALDDFYRGRGWIGFHEVRDSLGYQHKRSIDFLALNCWPSKGYRRVAVEIKVTLADFRREIADPSKREPFERICHEFWFATIPGVIPLGILPPGCGLVEILADGSLNVAIQAVEREPIDPPIDFWVSIARQSNRALQGVREMEVAKS